MTLTAKVLRPRLFGGPEHGRCYTTPTECITKLTFIYPEDLTIEHVYTKTDPTTFTYTGTQPNARGPLCP